MERHHDGDNLEEGRLYSGLTVLEGDCAGCSCVNLTQARVIEKEGTSIEKTPP
jgi:Fe-S cluster biogenesis protein NfuA